MGKLLNDLKCTLIQKAVYAKVYKGHKPNEWEPWNTPEVKTLKNGTVCRSDVKYGETYPNSFADVWYPDGSTEKRPVVVYFHGGGFIFGNKSDRFGRRRKAGSDRQSGIYPGQRRLRAGAAVPLPDADPSVRRVAALPDRA